MPRIEAIRLSRSKIRSEKGRRISSWSSTNLIEAGVDISFECVYRSMARLDSLAPDRRASATENGEMEYGTIHLIELEGENTGNMEELHRNKKRRRV